MKIQESMENYLETIYVLEQKTGFVRSVDVATELGFSKPSISNAMKKLKADGLRYFSLADAYRREQRNCHGRCLPYGTYPERGIL